MLTKRMNVAATIAGIVAMVSVVAAAEAGSSPEEQTKKLVAVLKSDAPLFEKAKACQQLAVFGTKDAIAPLAELLSNPELAHYARFGLEPIPDPAVDEALRAALGRLKGGLLVGVVNSIGARRDAHAVGDLRKLLAGADAQVAAAAASALGRIASPETAAALKEALAKAPAALRPALADGCFFCAEAFVAQGKRDEAASLYDAVRAAEMPKHIQIAATRGAIIARQEAGAPLLLEQLRGADYGLFALAIGLARDLPGRQVTAALVAELPKLPAERQALLIQALGDRGDAAATPGVLEAAKSGSPEARSAAISALTRMGDASAAPVLLEAAASTQGEVAKAAVDALASIPGTQIDEAIVARLDRSEGTLRAALIDLAGRRRIAAALPALRKAAAEENDQIRLAAIAALGKTVRFEDLSILTGMLASPKSEREAAAAQEALRSACGRMPDRDACAGALLKAMEGASVETKCLLLEVFNAAGGAKALAAVAQAARDPNEEIRDTATRVLGTWRSEDAAGELLALAKGATNPKDRARTFAAFKQLILKLGFPNDRKLELCKQAMELAARDEERTPILEAAAGMPTPEALAFVAPYITDLNLKEAGCAAAVAIAERVVRNRPRVVAEPMKLVVQSTERQDIAERARRVLRQSERK